MKDENQLKDKSVKDMFNILSSMDLHSTDMELDTYDAKKIKFKDKFLTAIRKCTAKFTKNENLDKEVSKLEKDVNKLARRENNILVKQSEGGFAEAVYQNKLENIQMKKEEKLQELTELRVQQEERQKSAEPSETVEPVSFNDQQDLNTVPFELGQPGEKHVEEEIDAPIFPAEDEQISSEFDEWVSNMNTTNSNLGELQSISQKEVNKAPKKLSIPALDSKVPEVDNNLAIRDVIGKNVREIMKQEEGEDIVQNQDQDPTIEFNVNDGKQNSSDNMQTSNGNVTSENVQPDQKVVIDDETKDVENLNNQFSTIINTFNQNMGVAMQQMTNAFNIAMTDMQKSAILALSQKQEELNATNNTLNDVRTENKSLKDENQKLQLDKNELTGQVNDYTKKVSEKDTTIKSQQTTIDKLTAEVGEKDSSIAELKAQINVLQKHLFDETVARQKAEVAAKHAKEETDKVAQQFNQYNAKLQEIITSVQNNTIASTQEEQAYTYQK